MATNYVGNSIAVQSPDNAPQPGQPPEVSLEADTDSDTAANWYQAHKRAADEFAYLKSGLWIRHQENYVGVLDGASLSNAAQISNYGQLSAQISGSSTLTVNPGTGANLLGRQLQCAPNAGYSVVASAAKLAPWNAPGGINNLIFVLDMAVAQPNTNVATALWFYGISSALNWGASLPSSSIGFTMPAGTSNPWTATTWNGAAQVNTTIASTYNPTGSFQRMRIEQFGSATPQGVAFGSAYTRFSISVPGSSALVIVASVAGAPSISSGGYIVQGAYQSGVSATGNGVGPWLVQYNLM